ncbi:hypothetical protein [Microbacterium sp.]|uniref:hypothetical protein n=1 Tax=Microbacterium sp. TaxID=51671 RepID=UPI003F729D92
MMARQSSGRRGLMWAIIGGIILLVGIATIIVIAVTATRGAAPTPSTSDSQQPSTDPSIPNEGGDVVDATVTDRGWIPEPITTDADAYIRAAIAAASTFDTTKADRDDWLAYLDTWFTSDTRYNSEDDREAELTAAKLELRQGVVLPQEEWDSLARSDGRVVAETASDVVFTDVPDDASGDMSIGTADMTLTFTQGDGSGGETSFDDVVRVSVQVLCGPESVPTPGSAQRPGDCKVVRFFTEPLEP